jgi:hypothetical protein
MGAHILTDNELKLAPNVCGLCLATGPECTIYLARKGRGKDKHLGVDAPNSTCCNRAKFSITSAAKPSKTSPCTNHPIQCPFGCSANAPAIWTYSALQHAKEIHLHYRITPEDKAKYTITEEERKAVFLWVKKRAERMGKIQKEQENCPALRISDAHSSAAVFE